MSVKLLLNNFIMFLLISSTGGLIFVFNRNVSYLFLFFIILVGFFYVGKGIKKSNYYSALLSFTTLFVLFFCNYFFATNFQSLTKYTFNIIIILTTLFVFIYFNNQKKESLLNSLYFVLKLILYHSVLSFLFYFFVSDDLFLISSQHHDSLVYNYLFYYSPKSASALNLFGIDLQRNAGIFWEPGILQIYLNILFFLELTYFNKNKSLLILIILTIVSTYSTTGLFLLMLQIVYFSQKEYKRFSRLVILVLITLPLYFLFNFNLSDKIYGQKSSSFQKRLIDLTQPFYIAVENPLTGIGLDLDSFQKEREEFYINSNLNDALFDYGLQQNLETSSKGSTNSIMYILAGMGFPTTILFLYMLIKQQIVRRNRLLWMSIILISVMSEPLLLRPFFFIFIVSGFVHLFNRILESKSITI